MKGQGGASSPGARVDRARRGLLCALIFAGFLVGSLVTVGDQMAGDRQGRPVFPLLGKGVLGERGLAEGDRGGRNRSLHSGDEDAYGGEPLDERDFLELAAMLTGSGPIDVRALVERVSALERSSSRDLLFSALFLLAHEAGARAEVERALTEDLEREAPDRARMLRLAASIGIGVDPGATPLPFVFERVSPREQPHLLNALLAAWALEDPELALGAASAIAHEQQRLRALERVTLVAFGLGLADPREHPEELEAAFGDVRRVRELFERAELYSDPLKLAFDRRGQIRPDSRLLQQLTCDALRVQPPLEALRRGESFSGDERRQLRRCVLENWGRSDPIAAAEYAKSHTRGEERSEFLQAIARGYAARDPDGAAEWVALQLDGGADLELSLVEGLSEADPLRALELAFGDQGMRRVHLRSSAYFSARRMLETVAHQLVEVEDFDMGQAFDLALARPTSEQQQAGADALAGAWMQHDADRALEWATREIGRRGSRERVALARSFVLAGDEVLKRYLDRLDPESRKPWDQTLAELRARDGFSPF